MKTATISSVPSRQAPGYAWAWHCAADSANSTAAFGFYYDCVVDARGHGYGVDPVQPHGPMAPGGARYALPAPGCSI